MNSLNALAKYNSPKFEFYSIKPETFFINESEIPELTIIKYESQKIIKKSTAKEYKKAISERLKYLSENLDEDQDLEIFNLSRNTVENFISYIKTTELPLISIDNSGNIIFEWREYNQYEIIMMLFKSDGNISLTGVKEKKCLIKASGIISEVSNVFLQL